MKKLLVILCFCSLTLLACETPVQDEYEEFYVLEAILEAGQPLPLIKIDTTAPMGESFNYSENSTILNADVQIHLLSENGEIEQVYSYGLKEKEYLPIDEHKVLSGRTYKLHVNIPGYDQEITAVTTVPQKVHIISQSADSLTYLEGDPLQLELAKSSGDKRDHKFLINMESKDYKKENLTPVFKEIVAAQDIHFFERLWMHLWGMFTENSFQKNNEGHLHVTYPWNEYPFYGNNNIIVNSIDDNMFDFLRSQQVQQGDGESPPGEIYNIITHIDGALGLFGSLSADTARVYLKR